MILLWKVREASSVRGFGFGFGFGGGGGGGGGVFGEEGASDGEENEEEVEGFPAVLYGVGPEHVGSEGAQRGKYDEHQRECRDKEEYEK